MMKTLQEYIDAQPIKYDMDNLMNAAIAIIKMNEYCRGYKPEEFARYIVDLGASANGPTYIECRGVHICMFYMDGETYPLRAKVAVGAYTARKYVEDTK